MGEWDTTLIEARTRAEATKTFTFERPSDLEYQPGQFFFVMLPRPGTRPIEHHFSFSSSPTEPVVEFTTRMTGSEFKTDLDALKPGDTVHIAGPDGAFVLGPEMRKVAFLAGGIGITPARSVLRWVLDSGADIDIVVMHGERDQASSPFAEEFSAVSSDHARVVTVLSHPEPGWDGPVGHIDAEHIREQIPDWPERHFFVSGPAPMVNAVVQALTAEVGIPAEKIKSEHFPGYAGMVAPTG